MVPGLLESPERDLYTEKSTPHLGKSESPQLYHDSARVIVLCSHHHPFLPKLCNILNVGDTVRADNGHNKGMPGETESIARPCAAVYDVETAGGPSTAGRRQFWAT